MIWDSPFSPCTNCLKFPFPPSEPLVWDFPVLPWRAVTCPSAHQISCCSSSSLSKHKEEGENRKSHSQLSASSGSCFPRKKCDPDIFQWVMVLVWVSWGKNAFICLGFPIRQPFYCSLPSCMISALSDTPATGPVPFPKAALCPGHKETAQPWDETWGKLHVFHWSDFLPAN